MKLSDLRGLIRKPGNPTMTLDLGNGVPMTIAFQKTPLLDELGKAFNDERTAETGLTYDPETNVLSVDGFVGEIKDAFGNAINDLGCTQLLQNEIDAISADHDAPLEGDDEDDDLL